MILSHAHRRGVLRGLVTILVVAAAAGGRALFLGALGTRAVYITFYPAVMLAALYGGFPAGLLATILSALAAAFFWMEPVGQLLDKHSADWLGMGVFVMGGTMISWIAEARSRARERASKAEIRDRERQRAADVQKLVEDALRREGEKLRQLNRTLKAHTRSAQALTLATGEPEYLKEICDIIIEECGHAMVWVGFREDDEKASIRPVAWSGFEKGYLETLDITWADEERGHGPTGTAIRTGRTCTCRNMLTDPLFLPWREEAIRREYASSVALPLLNDDKAFGALTIYSVEPDPFADDELELLTGLANDFAYGINVIRLRAAHERAEQARRESDELLRFAHDAANSGAWEWDLRTNENVWSEELWKVYGLEPHSLQPSYEAWCQLIHPDDRARAEQVVQEAARNGTELEVEFRVRDSAAGERWILARARPERDPDGQVVRFIGIAVDITGRKRAEQAEWRAAEYRRLALEAAELGAWDYHLDTDEVFWDRRCRDMFGIAAGAQISYAEAIASIHEEDRAAVDEAMKQAIAGGGLFRTEFRVVWPDASVHWLASYGRVYFEGEGSERRAVRFIGVNMEITDRKRAEERLRESQKLESVGLLAGGVAHDFNNLLVGVIGNASLAGDMVPQGSPVAEILERIVKSGERAAHLTRQMLAYAGKGRFIIEPVDLSRLVRDTLGLVRSSISISIQFDLRLASDIPAVESDASQMQQVFMNLALNAAEAIGEGPGVIVAATGRTNIDAAYITANLSDWAIEPGEYVFLEVSDTGCGMDRATSARIFEPFFTTKFQGRGLGLAAVAGIVRAHKGAVKLNTASGAGATFRVLLPALVASSAVTAPLAQAKSDLRGRGTILVVDDEKIVRDLAKRSLEHLGYDVLLAASGPAAIELLKSGPERIQLAILDLSMPGMSGKDALPHLRKLKPDLNVIVSSGFSEAEALRVFHGARVSGFIQKPYTIQSLARKVKSVLA